MMAEPNALAETVAYSGASMEPASSLRGRVALVEARSAGQPDENLRALAQRLRVVCGILLVGYTIFFVRQLVMEGIPPVMAWNWGVVFTALVISAVLLAIMQTFNRALFSGAEALIFGGTAWYFASTIHFGIWHNLRPPDLPWAVFNLMIGTTWICVLAFTYTILFPDSWRRVACVVSLLLTIPAVVMLYDRYQFPEFAAVVNVSMMTLVLMTLATCGGAVVFFAFRFSQLRREAAIARRFGQYQLKEQIGGGGMGEVYLAEHILLTRPCALKRIRPGKDTDPVTLARFEREVRATAELSHPHTVDIYDYGRAGDGTFYYVMEYLSGLTLEDLVRRHGPLPAPRVVFLLRQVCEALEEAHSAGLIHRDIKPGNIFAARRGGQYDFIKLLDFGLVMAVARNGDPALSRVDGVVGSPLYMAPEQFSGETPDARADIYALGAVGYFLLAGRPPFVTGSPYEIMLAHTWNPVRPPSQTGVLVPPDVEGVILRCLSKEPAQRFQSACALGEALATCSVAGNWTFADAARWWQLAKHPGGTRTV